MATGVTDGIAWRIDGAGPPVLLIHAGVADHRMWDGVAGGLADSYTVVRYDLRGFGASPVPTTKFRHIDDLIALLDQLGLPEVDVIGNSLGGRLALNLCGAAPGRLRRLVLLAPAIGGRQWSSLVREYGAAEGAALEAGDLDTALRLNLDMWVRGPARDWSAPLQALAEQVSAPMRTALANQLATEAQELDDDRPPVEDRLSELAVPALIGVGDCDVPDFLAIAEHVANMIPAAEFVRFPGAGHLLPVERPAEVTAAIRRFLT